MTTLVMLLERGLEKVGGLQQDLATALGISRPRVNRLLKNDDGFKLGIRPCFKLAELLREDALMVLRIANKGWLADYMEARQRKGVKGDLTDDERSILEDHHVLAARSPQAAESLRKLLGDLATEARTKPPKRRARKKAR